MKVPVPLNMNNDLLLKLYEDNIQLKKIIFQNMKNSSLTPASSSWINGILNVLDSKVIIKSTIDDLQWFHNYGMAGCKRILDIGCGAGYISLMISRMGKDVIGYEFIGKWVGQEHKEDDYRESFSFTHNCVKQIAMANGGGDHLNFNFYQSFPLDILEASIDCVVMYAVLEHLDPFIIVPFFSELRRILKPKGLLFIAKLPRKLSYQEHLAHFLRIPHHDRLYTRKMVNDVLSENGFDILRVEKTGLFFNHPNRIVNPLFRFTTLLENVIDRFFPPLKIFAHDYRVVAVKK